MAPVIRIPKGKVGHDLKVVTKTDSKPPIILQGSIVVSLAKTKPVPPQVKGHAGKNQAFDSIDRHRILPNRLRHPIVPLYKSGPGLRWKKNQTVPNNLREEGDRIPLFDSSEEFPGLHLIRNGEIEGRHPRPLKRLQADDLLLNPEAPVEEVFARHPLPGR